MAANDQIPGTSFTEAEAAILAHLLQKVAADGGFWPDEACFAAAGKAMSRWALELVILIHRAGKLHILLTLYGGGVKEFKGKWCIPGGYGRTKHIDLQGVCSEVAGRELGTDVVFSGDQRDIWGYHWWQSNEHPQGRPFSLFVFCRVPEGSAIEETPTRRFFPVDELPETLVGPHRKFVEEKSRNF